MDFIVFTLGPVFWMALLIFINLPPSNQELCAIGNPVIVPKSLVVKHGDPATATCKTPFRVDVIGWRNTTGVISEARFQELVWKVDSVTDWSMDRNLTCFVSSEQLGQCQTRLPITIYKVPERVSLVLLYPTVPLIEGRKYTFNCIVQKVGPLANLTVRWFQGDNLLDTNLDTNGTLEEGTESEIATVKYRHVITVSKEDHGSSYRCAAKLDMDAAEYPSNSIRVEVLYKPRVTNASEDVSLKPEARLDLVCEGEGNPSPSYLWRHNGVILSHENKTSLSIESVDVRHAGVYECILSNKQGDVTVSIKVDVEVEESVATLPVTGVLVAIAVLVIMAMGIATYCIYHRKKKTDNYHLWQLSARSKSVVATAPQENALFGQS